MTDRQQIKAGRKVKIGVAQLDNDTPMFMKYIMRGFAGISGLWALLPPDLLGLTDLTTGKINRWIVVLNAVLLFGIKFFGWEKKR